MNFQSKCELVWNQALERALGAGHPDPFTYADKRLREWIASSR